ncbi:MAG: hypothetical protein ABSD58_03275 [Verrucomicrobiia bacterium]|jgi:hypothetical protein
MDGPVIDLDKAYAPDVPDALGTIQIRIVVLKPKPTKRFGSPAVTVLDDPDLALILQQGGNPLDAYMERPTHGKQCIVFLINGQRHEAWDNIFIVRDLGFKYLRNRTMIIVDLDGLSPRASAEVIQGSRQGLFAGNVYHAMKERLVATLKGDPDLKRLESEAEQQIAALETGDEAVKSKLDQLIEEHHTQSARVNVGGLSPGNLPSGQGTLVGLESAQAVVTKTRPEMGLEATRPVLTLSPPTESIRVQPNSTRVMQINCEPQEDWPNVELFEAHASPAVDGLTVGTTQSKAGAELSLAFIEPEDFDEDDYPVSCMLQVFARFKGHDEARMLECTIIISKPIVRPPRPKPVLLPIPTVIRIVSRQPVKLIPGGPSKHVKLSWDGEDSLAAGLPPAWSFQARCLTHAAFRAITFSRPKDGRFEALVDTPQDLTPNAELDFEVEAIGPNSAKLATCFRGVVVNPPPKPEPRKVTVKAPEPAAVRRPPYELKYVEQGDWVSPTCWGEAEWTETDTGCFREPTNGQPLTLIINKDAALLKEYREDMIRRKLAESTIQEHLTRYTAHVAFHLYQMYRYLKSQRDAREQDDKIREPEDSELRAEINRVASTIIMLMEVSR